MISFEFFIELCFECVEVLGCKLCCVVLVDFDGVGWVVFYVVVLDECGVEVYCVGGVYCFEVCLCLSCLWLGFLSEFSWEGRG